jgi:hypothetical protein
MLITFGTRMAYSCKNREKNGQNQHSNGKTKLERRGDESECLAPTDQIHPPISPTVG